MLVEVEFVGKNFLILSFAEKEIKQIPKLADMLVSKKGIRLSGLCPSKSSILHYLEAWAEMNFNGFNGRSSLLQESVLWHKSQAKIAKIFTNNQFEGDQRD